MSIEGQDRCRLIASCATLAAVPGFLLCGLEHFCMDGHMAHPPYSQWERWSDIAWIVLLVIGALTCMRSNLQSRGWLTGLLLSMIFGRFVLGIALVDFIAIPPAIILAIRGFLTRDASLLPLACCKRCTYDLTGNVSGVCPECGTAIRENCSQPLGR